MQKNVEKQADWYFFSTKIWSCQTKVVPLWVVTTYKAKTNTLIIMKNNLSTLFIAALLLLTSSVFAADLTGKRIYVDPGHGSYGFNDRPQSTIPYPFRYSYTDVNGKTSRIPDTTGFFETNTNLWKCLYLGKKLEAAGATVSYSHTKAGPNPYPYINGTAFDWNGYKADPNYKTYYREPRNIREDIGANYNDYDFFISVHSNAPDIENYEDDELSCYPMFLYRGYNKGTYEKAEYNPKNKNTASFSPYNPQSYEMAHATWKHCYELIEGVGSLRHPKDPTPALDKTLIFGDRDYYYYEPNDTVVQTLNGVKYSAWLGVVCHAVPGFLAEGYHHSYGPARHRALNRDYCHMEGLAYFRGIRDYFGADPETVGYICGVIKNNTTKMFDHPDYQYHPNSHDQWMPCNGAVVVLKKAGKEIKRYTCDNNYNGIFVFYDLEPGTYTLESEYDGLTFSETVEVVADKTTYSRLYPIVTPHICAYDLTVEQIGDSYTFSFYANSNAEKAKIVFYNSEKEEIGSHPITVVKGNNSITLSTFNLPGDAGQTLSWAVELNGKEITEFALVHSDKSLDMHATSQLFNAVNTNPMSEKFGHIYVMHRGGRKSGGDLNETAASANNGLWEFDHALTKQHNQVYQGGKPFGHPTRMSIDSEGYLYISDWSDGNSGIYIANTADLTQNFTQFFQGTPESNGAFNNGGVYTGSSTPGNFIYGEGKDTKLYVYDEDVASNGVLVYNIGQEDGSILRTWGNAPSATIKRENSETDGNSAVWATSKGVFVSQHRANYHKDHPSLQFYDNTGNLTYTSSESSIFDGSNGAGFAVSTDESILVLNSGEGSKQFKIFDITWNGTTPTLALRTTYKHGLGAIRQMNWDYAGNLVCSGDDGIHIFAVPTDDNTTLVPARATIIKETPTLAPAAQRIWAFDLKQKPTMTGYQFTFKSVTNGVGSLILKDEQGEALKSFDLPSVTQGENTFTIPYDDMPQTSDDLSWEITLAAGAVEQGANLQEVTTDEDKYYYYLAQDVTTNTNPESEHFGKIYVLETYNGKNDGKSNHSKTQKAGIYVYDPLLNLENYAKGYLPEGVDITNFTEGHQYRVLHRIAVDPITNDVAFVQSKTNQLWIANPDDLNAPATNIIQGLGTYASSLCYDSNGNLFVFGYNSAEEKAIIYKKEAGSADFNPFVEIDPWEYENERNSMAADGRGGLWVISKYSGNDYGNFFHINQNGDVDLNISTNGTTLTGKLLKTDMPANMPIIFNRGQLAYDAKRNILAIGGDSKVTLYKATYSLTTPSLEYWTSTSTLGNIDGIAFDYAGDLHVMCASKERFYKFAVPTDNNVCTTLAPQIIPHRFVLQDTKHNQTNLQSAMSQTVDALVCRSLTAGMYNTLCLPFALDAFEDTPLEGATVLEYSHSEELDGDILLYFDAVTNMEAGVPYLVEPQADIDVPMDFMGVRITETDEEIAGEPDGNGISFNGILAPKTLAANDKSILFLVSGNRLAWANANADMYGMRGYFFVPNGKYNKLSTRAYISTKESETTDLQQTSANKVATKFIQNGVLYIQREGEVYTIMGTKVQ